MAIARILQDSNQNQLVHPDYETGPIVDCFNAAERLESLFIEVLPHQIRPTQSDRLPINREFSPCIYPSYVTLRTA